MDTVHEKRQGEFGGFDPYSNDGWWEYSRRDVIIKWTIVGFIFLFFIAWFVGGYFHAKSRMKKGLPLLAYHRWLIPRSQRIRFQPNLQNEFSFYQTHNGYTNGYGMQAYPPPAYNTDNVPPPTYQPPEGGSKVNPHQDYAVPPPGPPPVGAPSSSDQENQVAERPVRPAKARWMNRVNPFK